jgi:hypothetical protein
MEPPVPSDRHPRTRPAHTPDPLCALEAEAVTARRNRDAALARLADHPSPGSFDYMAQAADLPFGYVTRGPLSVSAIETMVPTRFADQPMVFHYHHLNQAVTRDTALGLLRRHLAAAPAEVMA